MGQTIADSIWEEGRTIGYSEGEVKGEVKGELKALRRTLRQLLEDRFGGVPEAALQRIESVTDPERLQAAIVQVLHVATPEGLQL